MQTCVQTCVLTADDVAGFRFAPFAGLCQYYFVPVLLCVNTTLCQYYFVPTLPRTIFCANTTLCQHYFVPTLLCVNTTLCQHYFVPTLHCVNTTLCQHYFVPTLLRSEIVFANTALCQHYLAMTLLRMFPFGTNLWHFMHALLCANTTLCQHCSFLPTLFLCHHYFAGSRVLMGQFWPRFSSQ